MFPEAPVQIINADPTRMIDLPGVGPCPRPVDIDETVTGFTTLKSLRIYSFAAGQAIEGESESDEVYVVPIGGAISMQIEGAHPLQATLSDTGPRALYMTRDHAYRLDPKSDVQVAYARAASTGRVATHVVDGTQGDTAETLAFAVVDLAAGDAVDTDAGRERLVHVIDGVLAAGDVRITASQTVALPVGKEQVMTADKTARVLIVSA